MKKIYVMMGLVVLLGAAAFLANFNTGDRVSAVRKTVDRLPAIDTAKLTAFEVVAADGTVRVERQGAAWVVPAKARTAVAAERMSDFLKALADLDRADAIAYKESTFADYDVAEAGAKHIKLFYDPARPELDLIVGKIDSSRGPSVTAAGNFVRRAGGGVVFSHTHRLNTFAVGRSNFWIDSRLFPLLPKDINDIVPKIERVALEFEDRPTITPITASQPETRPFDRVRVVLTAKDPASKPVSQPATKPAGRPPVVEREWTVVEPAGHTAEIEGRMVEGVVRTALAARCDDVVGTDASLKEYGLDNPSASVEVTTSDGVTRRLRVGNLAPPSEDPVRRGLFSRYAACSGSDRVFLMSDATTAMFRKKPADLLKPPPPPPPPPPPAQFPPLGPESRPLPPSLPGK